MVRNVVAIISPAPPQSNNGNSRTAEHWARMLSSSFEVVPLLRYRGEPVDALIALHARRSAEAVAAYSRQRQGPVIVILTGTDLYRDLAVDARARRSLELAEALVVLQEKGVDSLPPACRPKTVVIYQSAQQRRALPKARRWLRAVMVAHLRDEKGPATFLEAARLLRGRRDVRLDLVGQALDPALARLARRTERDCPHFRWLGPLPHRVTLGHIQRAHLLVNCSRMEGGAHVLAEAVRCHTPVLASRIDGNLGMLGEGYRGYFPLGDAGALAELVERCRDEPRMLSTLSRQCRAREARFEPGRERRAILSLVCRVLRKAGR